MRTHPRRRARHHLLHQRHHRPAEDGPAHPGQLRHGPSRDRRTVARSSSGDVHWNLSDTGWAKAAWSSFFGPWQIGACVFAAAASRKIRRRSRRWTSLARYPITTWCAPPTALRLIVREDLARWSFPHLRHCVSAGEPLNPEVIAAWKHATGHTIYEGYGQTETVVLIGNFRSRGDAVRPGSMGRPSPGLELAVLDREPERGARTARTASWPSASSRIARWACSASTGKTRRERRPLPRRLVPHRRRRPARRGRLLLVRRPRRRRHQDRRLPHRPV